MEGFKKNKIEEKKIKSKRMIKKITEKEKVSKER